MKSRPTRKSHKPSYFSFDYPIGRELTIKHGTKKVFAIGAAIALSILALEAASMVFTPLYAINLGIKLGSLLIPLVMSAHYLQNEDGRAFLKNERKLSGPEHAGQIAAIFAAPGALFVPYLLATHPVTAFSMAAYLSLTAATIAFLTHDTLKGKSTSIIARAADACVDKVDEWMSPKVSMS